MVTKGSKVLDLGCAEGLLGSSFCKIGCTVIGVEISQKSARKAKNKINKVITGNIEDVKVFNKIKNLGPYDIVFASSIFEHLVNPQYTAIKLSKLLKKNGFMIITLPNIGHWTARLSILLGKFDYQDSGIFDRTHLHFYTIKTAREFFKESNLTIKEYDYELTEFPILHRLFKLLPGGSLLQFKFYRFFPAFFAYQMMFKVNPTK
ncbi:class I SAM-dependent methyltransferase [Candidatus Daviesbacteria bacterium]|nr:class I SAM-dependent methyltransferase [Candidatus Daviesbacteria bacterium]